MNQIATIGHNSPPLTPFEIVSKKIDDLYGEAKLWLDGSVVDSENFAEGATEALRALTDRSMLLHGDIRADKVVRLGTASALTRPTSQIPRPDVLGDSRCVRRFQAR